MKALMLTNGQQAIPFRIEFLLTRNELISALCWSVRNLFADEPLPALTGAEVVERVRDTLKHAGAENYSYWADELGIRTAVEVEAWARPLVERAFGKAFA